MFNQTIPDMMFDGILFSWCKHRASIFNPQINCPFFHFAFAWYPPNKKIENEPSAFSISLKENIPCWFLFK